VHEVRNGLGTLAGYVRLLERSAGTSAEAAEIIRSIRDECATLESVIRRIVEFVRTEKLRQAEFDLKRLLERVVAREGRSRPGAEAQVLLAEPLLLVGDEDLLERAFENLVRNARDAAGPAGHVTVDAARDGEVVTVRVSDDGPGLAAEVQGRLRPFATTKAGGLGLGLPMALKILTLHGGALDLLPREPRGLTAVAQIPPCRDSADATFGSARSGCDAPIPER
jgi:signal transduction histidine kinase